VAQRLIAVLVLDLALQRTHRLAVLLEPDRDVHIEPARAFLETHLRDAREDEDITKGAYVGLTFFGGAHVRLAHDLEQRNARAIEVDERVPTASVLAAFERSGVLLEVSAGDSACRSGRQLEPS